MILAMIFLGENITVLKGRFLAEKVTYNIQFMGHAVVSISENF